MTARLLRRLRVRLARVRAGGEAGSAVVEFLGVTLLLLVPTVYLVLTLARIEAAAFAAEGAARETGRIIASAPSMESGLASARHAIELAFADQGLEVDPGAALELVCSEDPCLSPGAYVHVSITTSVPLPLLPDVVAEATRADVRIQAAATTGVDRFRERP